MIPYGPLINKMAEYQNKINKMCNNNANTPFVTEYSTHFFLQSLLCIFVETEGICALFTSFFF